MATLLFVHGTGVRRRAFEDSLEIIRAHLHEALIKGRRGEIKLEPCLWGDSFGSRLNAKGASVPDYESTGTAQALDQDREDRITLWKMLSYDPFYELHGLALRPRENEIDADAFTDLVRELPSKATAERLSGSGIAKSFGAARDDVLNADVYEDSLASTTDPSDLRGPVARAIVARAMALTPDDRPPAVRFDPLLRDEVVEAITGDLGEATKGVVGWAANTLFKLAQQLHIVDLKYRRGAITDGVAPETGDIVLYQANGDPIRGFIRQKIEKAHEDNPPVVVLAHSLGGIACVDLFAGPNPPKAHALVTVGSQAPYLFEINALHSLRYGKPLPAGFPKWLNIYDRRDLLSYVASKVFRIPAEPAPDVRDEEVDNGLPFPDSHGGYWANPKTWELILSVLP